VLSAAAESLTSEQAIARQDQNLSKTRARIQ
jgi:hypothetical protein